MELLKRAKDNGSLEIAISGRLDTITAPEFEAAVKEALPGLTELTLDCSGLEYLSSAGLRVLLLTHKAMSKQGSLKLTGVQKAVMEIFEMTGFADILTIA